MRAEIGENRGERGAGVKVVNRKDRRDQAEVWYHPLLHQVPYLAFPLPPLELLWAIMHPLHWALLHLHH